MKTIETIVNGCNVIIRFDDSSIHIYNGYQIKDDLKQRGYRFDPAGKSWYIHTGDIEGELSALKSGDTDALKKRDEAFTPGRSGAPDLPGGFPESYSVSELRSRIAAVLRSAIPGHVWIRGVVASEIKNYQWYSYFDLKDENEKEDIFFNVEVRTVNLDTIEKKIRDSGISDNLLKDLPVFVRAELKISSKHQVGVRLEILDILPEYTRSKLKSRMDITVDRLKEEGIFDLQKKLVLPRIIRNIGLITSEQGTSVRDILAGLSPYADRFNIYFLDSRMEGEQAVPGMISSIEILERHPSIHFDCVVIARGGGSEQSLGVFNDYELCRKVCLAKIPVLTAIGHEKDLSAIELCSNFTPVPSTPSGIGKFFNLRLVNEMNTLGRVVNLTTGKAGIRQRGEAEKVAAFLSLVPGMIRSMIREEKSLLVYKTRTVKDHFTHIFRNAGNSISYLSSGIFNRMRDGLRNERARLSRAVSAVDLPRKGREIDACYMDLTGRAGEFFNRAEKFIGQEEQKIKLRMELVRSSDPERILEKGFSMTLDEKNRPLTSLDSFRRSPYKKIRFFDGETVVEEKEKK